MNIRCDETKQCLIDLIKYFEKGRLQITNSKFTEEQCESYLSSILRFLPTNQLILKQIEDGGYICIQGNKRLNALYDFYKKGFKYLKLSEQFLFENYNLNVLIVRPPYNDLNLNEIFKNF